MGRNVEVIVSFGGLHEKHAVQRGILGTNSAFAQGPRKTTKNLDQVGCLLFKIQLNSVGLSVPHRKHITSPLRVQQANAVYRFVTMV
jgi:hypothetical protein